VKKGQQKMGRRHKKCKPIKFFPAPKIILNKPQITKKLKKMVIIEFLV